VPGKNRQKRKDKEEGMRSFYAYFSFGETERI
jgi:hypothetical protein